MITKLVIRNFQAHEKLVIDLDPHVTTVVGQSDKGKSAVLRALRWVALNQPGGEAFIRDGEDKATVTVEADGKVITRTKGKGVNTYHIGDKEFKAFGSDVPPEIAALLNVSELNFQGQHDGPFWFSETAGEVSRKLNEIINLGVIDSVLAFLGGRVREAGSRVTLTEERVTAAKTERARLDAVGDIDEALKHVEGLAKGASEAALAAKVLGELVKNVSEYGARHQVASKQATSAASVIALGQQWCELSTRVGNLGTQIRLVQQLKPVAERKFPDLASLERLGIQMGETKRAADRLRVLRDEVFCLHRDKVNLEMLLDTAEQEFHEQLGEECPLCGNLMSPVEQS